jgi:hypothetical protein
MCYMKCRCVVVLYHRSGDRKVVVGLPAELPAGLPVSFISWKVMIQRWRSIHDDGDGDYWRPC